MQPPKSGSPHVTTLPSSKRAAKALALEDTSWEACLLSLMDEATAERNVFCLPVPSLSCPCCPERHAHARQMPRNLCRPHDAGNPKRAIYHPLFLPQRRTGSSAGASPRLASHSLLARIGKLCSSGNSVPVKLWSVFCCTYNTWTSCMSVLPNSKEQQVVKSNSPLQHSTLSDKANCWERARALFPWRCCHHHAHGDPM